eukprot:TRINITY_DN17709_c0_g1_i1.p1 TRINITY_DN17709_c0_g1~~TRINITY_DN17709_c0_g1_i1.p1  ORF type:complete len:100 (+),score=3.03 TRINITY_DN17709_c0_g1_i1:251-550(+)
MIPTQSPSLTHPRLFPLSPLGSLSLSVTRHRVTQTHSVRVTSLCAPLPPIVLYASQAPASVIVQKRNPILHQVLSGALCFLVVGSSTGSLSSGGDSRHC